MHVILTEKFSKYEYHDLGNFISEKKTFSLYSLFALICQFTKRAVKPKMVVQRLSLINGSGQYIKIHFNKFYLCALTWSCNIVFSCIWVFIEILKLLDSCWNHIRMQLSLDSFSSWKCHIKLYLKKKRKPLSSWHQIVLIITPRAGNIIFNGHPNWINQLILTV